MAVLEQQRDADHGVDTAPVIPLAVWLVYEHEQWYALAEEFDIAGAGESPHGAIDNMVELLREYLGSCAEDGISLDDARRPISLTRKLELQRQRAATWLRLKRHEVAQRYRLPFEPDEDLCW